MRNAHHSASSQPDLDTDAPIPIENDLVIIPRPTRLHPLLLPPLLAILAAVGLLVYRVRTPDWHWSSPPSPETTQPAKPKTPAVVHVTPAQEPEPPAIAQAEPPKAPEPTSKPSETRPVPDSAPKVAQTREDIEKEAARIHAEREELERIKKAEGERLAKLPPKPRQHPSMEEMQALAMAEMSRMQREMDAMMQRMPMPPGFGPMPPLGLDRGRGGFMAPGFPPEIERQFQEMERRQEEFLRQAEARMRAHRGRPTPPARNGGRRPDVQRFSSPDGRIQGFRMRLESTGEDFLAF